jgi:hypothetical protein
MKILLPYMNFQGRDFFDNVIAGGIEWFAKKIYDSYDNVEVVQLDIQEKFTEYKRKKSLKEIRTKALQYEVDVIISNWMTGVTTGARMSKMPVPVVTPVIQFDIMTSTSYCNAFVRISLRDFFLLYSVNFS